MTAHHGPASPVLSGPAEVTYGRHGVRAAFAGDLTSVTADRFVTAVSDLTRRSGPPGVELDLHGVASVDAAGVRALLTCRRLAEAAGRRLRITGLQPAVRRVLEVTGMLGRVAAEPPDETPAAVPGPATALDEGLAGRLGDLARAMHRQETSDDLLRLISSSVIGTVPGAQYAGIMVLRRRRVETRAPTAQLVRDVDEAQYTTGQGPCLVATEDQSAVGLPDTRADRRWPEFSRRAAALGVGSVLSLRLHSGDTTMGSLNLYADHARAFTGDSERIGRLYATHASIAMAAARRHEQLLAAMLKREVIGQAKGILMERHKLSPDQAFGVLTQASQHTNTKLAEVAATLARTGELPRPARRPRTP